MQTTSQQIYKFCKNLKIVEFHDHIWYHHEMHVKEYKHAWYGIGSLICEIDVKMSEILESKRSFAQ